MRRKLLRLSLALVASVLPALSSLAQIPEGYYSSLKGKKAQNSRRQSIKLSKMPKY